MNIEDIKLNEFYYFRNKLIQVKEILNDSVFWGIKNKYGFRPNCSIENFVYESIPEKEYTKKKEITNELSDFEKQENKNIEYIYDKYNNQNIISTTQTTETTIIFTEVIQQ